MLGFVGHVGAEISSDNGVPGWVVLLVELFLDVGSNILLDVEFFEGYVGTVDGILLHLFVHISVLNYGLSLSC